MLMQVFFLRRKPATYMPFRLINLQNPAGFPRQVWVNFYQSLRDIFMYSRLTNAKFLGCFPHSCVRINDKVGDFNGPLLDISFQELALLLIAIGYYMWCWGKLCLVVGGYKNLYKNCFTYHCLMFAEVVYLFYRSLDRHNMR